MGVHAIDEAARVGHRLNGLFGRNVFRTCQVSYILRALKVQTYTAGPPVRIRQHPFIIKPPGMGGSFLTSRFLKDACGAVDIFSKDAGKWGRPRYLELDGGTTWEKIRGSCTSSGKLVYPLLKDADFLYASEFDSFLGTGAQREEKLYRLGVVLEEGRMAVSLLKMDELDDDEAKALKKETANIKGFSYSDRPRGFSYDVDVCAIFVTVPFEKAVEKKLTESGFYSRTDPYVHLPTNSEFLDYLRTPLPDSVDMQTLQATNLAIWRTKFESVPYPSRVIMQPVHDWLVDQLGSIGKRTGVPVYRFANLRDVHTVARLMTASAVSRMFTSRDPADTSDVKTIEYTLADAAFAKEYLELKLSHLSLNLDDVADGFDCPTWAKDIFKKFLKHYSNENSEPYPVSIEKSRFIAFVETEAKKTAGHARNAMSFLRRSTIITSGKHGQDQIYVDRRFLNECGFSEPTSDHDDAHSVSSARLEEALL